MDRIEDYWERGDGSRTPRGGAPFHNMAVYGWDLLDPQLLTATKVASRLARPTKDDPLSQLVEHHQDRAAWPVLQRARKGNRGRTVLDAVTDMSGPARAWRRWWSSWAPTTRSARSSRSNPPGHPRGTTTSRSRSVWRPASAATCGAPARSLPTGPCSRRSCAGSPPSTSSSRRSRRSPSRRSPAAPSRRSGRSRGTSRTTPGRGSPTTTSTPSAIRTSPARRPGRSTPPSTPTTRR